VLFFYQFFSEVTLMTLKQTTVLSGWVLVISIIGNAIAQASQYSDAVDASTPIGYWQLEGNLNDDGSGGNAGDWKVPGGGSDAGAFTAGPRSGSSFLGMGAGNQAASFNGSRFIEIQNSTGGGTIYDFDIDDDFSLGIWVQKTVPGPNNDFFFSKEEAANENRGYYLIRETGGFGPAGVTWKLQAEQAPPDAEVATIYDSAGLGTFDDGNWHFLVATHEGGIDGNFADHLSLYMDGSQVAEGIADDGIGSFSTIVSNVALTIGSRENGNVAANEASLDHAAIWDRELTSTEVNDLWVAADFDPFFVPPPIVAWVQNASGDWFNGVNWATGQAPNANDTTAVFGSPIQQGPRVIFNETAATVKALQFDTTSKVILAGAGVILDDDNNTDARIDVAQGTHEIQMPVSFLDNGTIEAQSGATIDFNGPIDLSGNAVATAGSVNINHSVVDSVGGGSLSGTGTLGTAGSTSIAGDLTFTGTLAIDIDSFNTDAFIVSGDANLSGSMISVDVLDSFSPSGSYTILDATGLLTATGLSLGGADASLFTLNVTAGLGGSVLLVAGPSLLGDYDNSGDVGLSDLNLVLFNWDASSVPGTWVNEIPVGTVGLGQLNGVLFNWGNTGVTASVPEPSSFLLIVVGLLVWRLPLRRN
jgi:hypothetical protein